MVVMLSTNPRWADTMHAPLLFTEVDHPTDPAGPPLIPAASHDTSYLFGFTIYLHLSPDVMKYHFTYFARARPQFYYFIEYEADSSFQFRNLIFNSWRRNFISFLIYKSVKFQPFQIY